MTNIAIAISKNIISNPGGTLQIHAEVLPANASNQSVTWSVSNGTGKAIINASGLLTAMNDGVVTVTALANDGSMITDSLEVTITGQVILVEAIEVFPTEALIPVIKEKNGILQMTARVSPENVTNDKIEWLVENQSGEATITENGLITAVADGSVKAVAKALDGSDKSGFCIVAITNQSPETVVVDNLNAHELSTVQRSGFLMIKSSTGRIMGDNCLVYSTNGILKFRERISSEPFYINISSYPPGIYFVLIMGNDSMTPMKISIY